MQSKLEEQGTKNRGKIEIDIFFNTWPVCAIFIGGENGAIEAPAPVVKININKKIYKIEINI